ncbi:MAG: acyl-CoA carboxylase subunit epsilon [Streptosporangiaceae bacterium]
MTEPEPGQLPPQVLSVLRGEPTPDELAALVVVLASRPPARSGGPGQRPSLWNSAARSLRAPLFPGAGAWRASGLPG